MHKFGPTLKKRKGARSTALSKPHLHVRHSGSTTHHQVPPVWIFRAEVPSKSSDIARSSMVHKLLMNLVYLLRSSFNQGWWKNIFMVWIEDKGFEWDLIMGYHGTWYQLYQKWLASTPAWKAPKPIWCRKDWLILAFKLTRGTTVQRVKLPLYPVYIAINIYIYTYVPIIWL